MSLPLLSRSEIAATLDRVEAWTVAHGWKAYDPFDGLNAWIRPFTLERKFLRQVVVQGVKRSPVNLRPWLGIRPETSTKGMGFFAAGFLKRYRTYRRAHDLERARFCLDWLRSHFSEGYSGMAWGNHFDYQTRHYFAPKGTPTLVWTSHIALAFVEAFEILGESAYLDVAVSASCFVRKDLPRHVEPDGSICFSYVPHTESWVHNANLLGAALLAKVAHHTADEEARTLALAAFRYAQKYQRPDGSWYYGEAKTLQWIDNWHTAYNLDCFFMGLDALQEESLAETLRKGFDFYLQNFFEPDGKPKYYPHATYPIDIQNCSQSINTLVTLSRVKDGVNSVEVACRVARWTLDHMISPEGYFYHWKGRLWTNRTPTFHWGQATMFHALAHLESALE